MPQDERRRDVRHAKDSSGQDARRAVPCWGALNLYASKPHAFAPHDESVAMLVAAHAAVVMRGSEVESKLRIALASRDPSDKDALAATGDLDTD